MTTKTVPTHAELLGAVDAIIDRCDDLADPTLDAVALLHTQLADHLAKASQVLQALSADDAQMSAE